MPRRSRYRPVSIVRTRADFNALAGRLAGMRAEIAGHARTRPNVVAPGGAVRAAAGLLADLRWCLARVSRNRIVPRLSREAVTWAELSLILGEAEHRFDRFGTLSGFDDLEPDSYPAQFVAARDDLMRLTAAVAQSLLKSRQEEEEQDQPASP